MTDSKQPSKDEIGQAVIDLISIKDMGEKEKFVTANSSILVSDAAIQYIDSSIERNTDELAIQLLQYHKDLLKDCLHQKIWIVFMTRRKMIEYNSQDRDKILGLITQLVLIPKHERLKVVKENYYLLRDQRSVDTCDVLIRTFSENGLGQIADRVKEIKAIIIDIRQNDL